MRIKTLSEGMLRLEHRDSCWHCGNLSWLHDDEAWCDLSEEQETPFDEEDTFTIHCPKFEDRRPEDQS